MAIVSGRLLRACRPVAQEDYSVSSRVNSGRGSSVSFIPGPGSASVKVMEGTGGKRKGGVVARVAVDVVSERETASRGVVDVGVLIFEVASMVRKMFGRVVEKRRSWASWKMSRKQAEMFIERGIINCRFFALFSVAGSLMGSILCFLEGCFFVLQSFLQYFGSARQSSASEGVVLKLLIEALDMFLVGTAMLLFGTGIYVLFVSPKEVKGKERLLISGSNFFGLFRLKKLPPWMDIESVAKAKLRIGRSVTMILQAGVLEKFKDVPLVTGFDLACFAGALLVSSACIFLLSRLSKDAVKR
ncbi:hypothetical protein H6P81_020991 [Aristolochia fimbriata]|uniref:Uncharacterized protein n=1 Tax=Aristolochia fimbriata TaxID=158543 RepID=A0AAV7DX79_ARIFI|nr:hypothetical protein H6P81_020991 [Aristolochia fimbriata]